MIKKLIKSLLAISLVIILSILYLSTFGIKTTRFNEGIKGKILEINKKIILDLQDVKFLLEPYDFTANIVTLEPTILLNGKKLEIKKISTSISLKSLFFNKFSINELKISTKEIKLDDLVLLARSFKNSTELFLLDRVIKDGFLIANIKLKFDDNGKIKENYLINGFIKNAKLNFFNKLNLKNLNLEFDINNQKYSITEVKGNLNDIEISSPLIEIVKKNDLSFVVGKILTNKKEFNNGQLSKAFVGLLKNSNIKKVKFSTENDISFNIYEKLKIKDLSVQSKINLDQLIVKNNLINLKPYLPSLEERINFENHKIIINYDKDKLDIKGNGKFLIKKKFDYMNYKIVKNDDKFKFNTKINLKNSKLLLSFLDYEKKENLDSSILIKGKFKKDGKINFDLISLIEKNNTISFENLNLSKNFKIISMDSFNFNYLNNRKIRNQLFLTKNNSNYNIEGKSLDASNLINKIMDNDDKNSSFFNNFNSKIILKIKKTYIDEINFIDNLSGSLNFKANKINDLNLKSTFLNGKTISLSIKTNDKLEKITKLLTDYPKPLIKRYNFIKGFEDGFLVYHSVKKDGISQSQLTINDFKVKEVPLFAKILSLASLQAVADILTGEGIRFADFEMKFSSRKKLITIEEMYAIGPAVSILMDGYIESGKLVSLRGTLVPATTINRSIASIPLLGNILVGGKTGEGVFGVSFKIKGAPKDLKTTVNPIKTLTPRFITRTLESIKQN